MNDFLNEVAAYLEAQGVGVWTNDATRNIFVGIYPAEPEVAIALVGLPGTTIGDQRDVPELQFPRFQGITRSPDYDQASDLYQALRTALHGKYNLLLPNWRVLRCHADQEGGPLGEDDRGRMEFSINFIAEINAQINP